MDVTIELPNPEATESLGRALGQRLWPGAVLALVGPLGAGKTHLTRAIAHGLAIPNVAAVTSPTFVLMQQYQARLPIYHFDTYRLRDSREFWDLGTEDYLHGDGVCIIEWADRVRDALPADRLEIMLEVRSPEARRAILRPLGANYESLVSQLKHHPNLPSQAAAQHV